MRVQPPATRLIRLALPFASLVAAAAGVGGCEKKEDIRVYNAPKEPPPTAVIAQKGVANGDSQGDQPIAWTLPEGWKEVPGKVQMRYATIAVSPENPGLVLTVSTATGDLLSNVNRWAVQQLGLPAVTPADLPKVVTEVETKEGSAQVVNLVGPESADPAKPRQQILAALLPHDDQVWFFKLMGSATLVEAQKAKFETFLKSIDFHASADHAPAAGSPPALPPVAGNLPDGHPPIAPATGSPVAAGPRPPLAPPTPSTGGAGDIAKWDTPAGWARNEGSSMRVLSFVAQGPQGNADVAVTPLGGGFDPTSNVNRWRGQIGLQPVDSVNVDSAEKVPVAGKAVPFFDLVGPQQRMLVAAVQRPGSTWYFKITGSAAAVEAQKDAFKAFLASVRFAGE